MVAEGGGRKEGEGKLETEQEKEEEEERRRRERTATEWRIPPKSGKPDRRKSGLRSFIREW